MVVRNLPVRRVRDVNLLADGSPLSWSAHPRLKDIHAGTLDPLGELHIAVAEEDLDRMGTVVAVALGPVQLN
ncbi:hypothetical protein ABT075_38395 [Streptomyces sp. NPDC002677]|uniref:hypothetical protein n=1 Tax=Streptomyces sp. NPDC002677 TaxID=3154774 RepID=UPI003326F96C